MTTAKRKIQKYPNPPKKAFRSLGLGVIDNGTVKVVAGFRFCWWDPFAKIEPIFVQARILRIKVNQ